MRRKSTARALGAALGAALIGGLFAAQPGQAASGGDSGPNSTWLAYDVYAGGLKAMRAELAVDIGEADYRLQLDAYFQGFIAKFFSLDFTVTAAGALSEGRLAPRDYEMNSVWQKDKERRIAMSVEGGEVTRLDIEPEDRRPTTEAVSPEQRAGALDPISALLWPIAMLLQNQACEGETEVFDGRKLFALRLEQQESVTLRPTGYSPFGGEAQVCHLFIEQTAGPKKERSRQRIPEYIRVYLAPLSEDGPPLPLRLEADNRLGRIILHLAEAKGALRAKQLTQRPAGTVGEMPQ